MWPVDSISVQFWSWAQNDLFVQTLWAWECQFIPSRNSQWCDHYCKCKTKQTSQLFLFVFCMSVCVMLQEGRFLGLVLVGAWWRSWKTRRPMNSDHFSSESASQSKTVARWWGMMNQMYLKFWLQECLKIVHTIIETFNNTHNFYLFYRPNKPAGI